MDCYGMIRFESSFEKYIIISVIYTGIFITFTSTSLCMNII